MCRQRLVMELYNDWVKSLSIFLTGPEEMDPEVLMSLIKFR